MTKDIHEALREFGEIRTNKITLFLRKFVPIWGVVRNKDLNGFRDVEEFVEWVDKKYGDTIV